jgi:hypothetical protein
MPESKLSREPLFSQPMGLAYRNTPRSRNHFQLGPASYTAPDDAYALGARTNSPDLKVAPRRLSFGWTCSPFRGLGLPGACPPLSRCRGPHSAEEALFDEPMPVAWNGFPKPLPSSASAILIQRLVMWIDTFSREYE